MTPHKRAKSRVKVTRLESRAREWKIANLVWLVDFAFAPVIAEADCSDAHARVLAFLSRSAPAGHRVASRADLDELRWLQTVTRDYVEKTASGAPWVLSLADLATLDPAFLFSFRPPLRPYYEPGNLRVIWLLMLGELLGGREGKRIVRCAESECGTILVQRKKGKFCRTHGSLKERARRHRRTLKDLPLVERRDRRHRAHQEHVKRTRGKKAAARVRKRPIQSWELQRDAIEPLAAKFGEAIPEITPPDNSLELFRDLSAEEARNVFAQMLSGGQPNLLAKYLDGDPLAKAKVEIIQARILAGPLNTKSTKRTDVKLKLKEKSKSDG